ncbi:HNH endonuclease [Lachnospiraceae bacterium ZAX-1]
MSNLNKRFDKSKPRQEYEKNRKKLMANVDTCALCGKLIDKTLKDFHPMSAEVDHIIPVSKGGDLTAMENLQLVHRQCNRRKSNKISENVTQKEEFNPMQFLNW